MEFQNGMDIYFRVAFKPIATLLRPQESFDKNGNPIIVEGKGRHDPCVLPRASSCGGKFGSFSFWRHLFLINKIRKF